MSSVEKRFYGIASATVSTMRTTGMMFSMAIASLSVHVFVGEQKNQRFQHQPVYAELQSHLYRLHRIVHNRGVFVVGEEKS